MSNIQSAGYTAEFLKSAAGLDRIRDVLRANVVLLDAFQKARKNQDVEGIHINEVGSIEQLVYEDGKISGITNINATIQSMSMFMEGPRRKPVTWPSSFVMTTDLSIESFKMNDDGQRPNNTSRPASPVYATREI